MPPATRDPSRPTDPRAGACAPRAGGSGDAARTIGLPVLGGVGGGGHMGSKAIRASKMGRWRATVLILVHVAIAAHIVQWIVSGMSDGERRTLSPVEPSESMYTLELGRVNAGFVFFAAALAATALFGRFFCGWGCHIVALQDLCAWMMRKVGIHPKPWRSRLLAWVPLGLAVYMFVWPTLRREVIAPLCERFLGETPVWLGAVVPLHGFTKDLFVEDFWATFAPWFIAIPYLLVVGFAAVYFLGSKGFCTYGCPYGGFFGPVERIAPVRIRVTDACHQCGHCTAVCSSNVRVAEEVRDFGMVVDPGCFKCLDCVSVCPNDALYVGIGKPSLLARPRVPEAEVAAHREKARARYDLTWPEEIACGVVFLVLFRGFRGMPLLGDAIPMLMAAGIAGVGAFMVFKTWRLARDQAVRGPRVQLKQAGRVTLAGWAFAPATVLVLGLGAQGTALWAVSAAGDQYAQRLDRLSVGEGHAKRPLLTHDSVYAPGYVPTPEAKALAERAIAWYERAAPVWRGGVGLYRPWEAGARLAWLKAVAGDLEGSEAALRETLTLRPPTDDLVIGLTRVIRLRAGAARREFADDEPTRAAVDAVMTGQLARRPDLHGVRYTLASMLAARGQPDRAAAIYDQALAAMPADVRVARDAALLHMTLNQPARAAEALKACLKHRPASGELKADLASVLLFMGRADEGRLYIEEALAKPPSEPAALARLAEALLALQREKDALALLERAARSHPHAMAIARDAVVVHLHAGKQAEALAILQRTVKANPGVVALRAELAWLLSQMGRHDEALVEARRALPGVGPNVEVLSLLAGVFAAAGKPEDAQPIEEAIRALGGPPPQAAPEGQGQPPGQ
ncbi:MAG: tetratricopeptide repeat protein [Phycisphaerae bacterium]|nr:tetratricopeptide repeat protein [Phycisphaerae bacterium]